METEAEGQGNPQTPSKHATCTCTFPPVVLLSGDCGLGAASKQGEVSAHAGTAGAEPGAKTGSLMTRMPSLLLLFLSPLSSASSTA